MRLLPSDEVYATIGPGRCYLPSLQLQFSIGVPQKFPDLIFQGQSLPEDHPDLGSDPGAVHRTQLRLRVRIRRRGQPGHLRLQPPGRGGLALPRLQAR